MWPPLRKLSRGTVAAESVPCECSCIEPVRWQRTGSKVVTIKTIDTVVAGTQAGEIVQILTSLGVVAFVFLSALAIMWGLERLGGRFTANIKATLEAYKNNLVIVASGLVGSYLAIVVAEFSGIYVIHYLITAKQIDAGG